MQRVLVFAVLTACAHTAAAQEWTGRVRAGFTAGVQADTTRLSQASQIAEYLEPAPVTARSPSGAVPWFDVGVVVRFAGDFGAGVSYSRLSDRSRASVAAAIPHPFYFNQPREVAGTIDAVRHKEAATHVNLVYVFARPRFDVALGGGASFFSVEQQLVSDIVYAESYPYDTAEFVDGVLAADTVSKTGYNVSVDVVYKVSDTWGVGGLLRFSRARVPFQVNNVDAGRVNVGGLQAGGGLRVMF